MLEHSNHHPPEVQMPGMTDMTGGMTDMTGGMTDMKGGAMGMTGGMMGMMKMYFHTGHSEYVLFKALHTNSVGDMVVACIVVFLLGVLYEGLKFLREWLKRWMLSAVSDVTNDVLDLRRLGGPLPGTERLGRTLQGCLGGGAPSPGQKPPSTTGSGGQSTGGKPQGTTGSGAQNTEEKSSLKKFFENYRDQLLDKNHIVQSLLHVVQVFLSYCLMLVFMTYNAWLCLAVVLGAGVGYFLFGWGRNSAVDPDEHCH